MNVQAVASATQGSSNFTAANTDKSVQDNLKDFYKARDAIYSETGK